MKRGAKQMKNMGLGRYALCSSIAAAMLAGCGGAAQPAAISPVSFSPRTLPLVLGSGSWKMVGIRGFPRGIVRDKHADFWVASGDQAQTLTRITPTGKATTYSIGYTPYEITLDASGNFWLTVAGNMKQVIRVTPQLQVTSYALTDDTVGGITFGGDGNVWVAENSHIGRVTPAGKVKEFSIPQGTLVAGWAGVTWAPDALVWFQTSSGLTSLDPKNGNVKFYNAPRSHNGGAIVFTSDHTLWYTTEAAMVTLVEFNPKTQHVTTYAPPPGFGTAEAPAGMILAPDGALWIASNHIRSHTVGGALVRFDLKSRVFTTYVAPKGYDWEWDIAAGRIGALWATGGSAAQILHVSNP
jgi:streptogramin lyase